MIKDSFVNLYPFILIILFAILSPIIINKGLKKISNFKFFNINKKSKTFHNMLSSCIKYIIYFISIILILKQLKVDLTPVLASAGLVTVILGISTKSILNDFCIGFLMVFEDQINFGDLIQLHDGTRGTIEDIGFRTLGIRDWQMRKVYIPYSEIKKIINFHKEQGRVIVKLTVSYDLDPKKIEEVFLNTSLEMNELYKDYLIVKPLNEQKENESIYVEEFQYGGLIDLNESSLIGATYCIKGLINCYDVFDCKSELRQKILKNLKDANIIPSYPHVIIENKNPHFEK